MPDVLAWIEASPLGRIVRESGPWTYPLVNLAHILGIASLFGAVLVLDLRLLGARRRLPVGPLAGAAVPLAKLGAGVALVSGLGLLSANATEYAGNPFLPIKLAAVALGLLNAFALQRSDAWRAALDGTASPAQQRRLAAMGAMSLGSWLTAVAAGRLIGYW